MRKWTAQQIRELACRVRMEMDKHNVSLLQALKQQNVRKYCRPIVKGTIKGFSGLTYETNKLSVSKLKKSSVQAASSKHKVSKNHCVEIESDDQQFCPQQFNQEEEERYYEQNQGQGDRKNAINIIDLMEKEKCSFAQAIKILFSCHTTESRKTPQMRFLKGYVIGLTGIGYDKLRLREQERKIPSVQEKLQERKIELIKLEEQVEELKKQHKFHVKSVILLQKYSSQIKEKREQEAAQSRQARLQAYILMKNDLPKLRQDKQQLERDIAELREQHQGLIQKVKVLERLCMAGQKRQEK